MRDIQNVQPPSCVGPFGVACTWIVLYTVQARKSAVVKTSEIRHLSLTQCVLCWNTVHPGIRWWYQVEANWLESYLRVVMPTNCDCWLWWTNIFSDTLCQCFSARSVNIFGPDHGKNAARSCANSMKWQRQQFKRWSFDLIFNRHDHTNSTRQRVPEK